MQPVTLHLSLDAEGTEGWLLHLFFSFIFWLGFLLLKVAIIFRSCLLCSSYLVTSSRHAHRCVSMMILNPLNLTMKINHYLDHSIMNLFCQCI